jgi:plastocyanin
MMYRPPMIRFAMVALVIAACGGSDSKTPDAPAQHDAPGGGATVQMVTCPGTPAATVTTSGFMYSPTSVTIMQGQVVQFTMPSSHDVVPGHVPSDSTISDSGLTVNFSETKCLMFTQTGSYGFHCMPHSFNGTVVVQ